MTSQTVRIIEGGKLVIPAAFRRAMGLQTGDTVVVDLVEGSLRVQPLPAAVKQAQAVVRSFVPQGTALVAELIAERHADAKSE